MANPSISIPDEMLEEIDDRKVRGVPRSVWIREAIARRFEQEDECEWIAPTEKYLTEEYPTNPSHD